MLTALAGTAFAQSTRWDELSNLPFKESYPTPETSARLYDEMQFQRAVQVYLWALDGDELVSRMHGDPNDIFGEAGFRSGGRVNDVIWDRERLGNLLLFGQTLQSSKAAATGDHLVLTGVLPIEAGASSAGD